MLQVEVGVLGCPNMPQAPISDDDCADVAQRSFDDDVGMIFAARRGAGTFAGPLWDESLPNERVFVDDLLPPGQCRCDVGLFSILDTCCSFEALMDTYAMEVVDDWLAI